MFVPDCTPSGFVRRSRRWKSTLNQSAHHSQTFPVMKGFKAGALNYVLSQTSPDAEIVAVIDSDYVVRKDWLRSLVPQFDNPKIG